MLLAKISSLKNTMFSNIKRALGVITLSVEGSVVRVEGINGLQLAHAMTRVWGTSKVANNMFNHVDRHSFSIESFFLVDLYYAIGQLMALPESRVARRPLHRLREILLEKTYVGNRDKAYPSILNRNALNHFHWTPTKQQVEFFEAYEQKTQALNLNGFLLAAAAGSGKTAATLFLADMLECDKVVLVCPDNAPYTVWKETIEGIYKTPQTYWISKDRKPFTGQERFLIFSYGQLSLLRSVAHQIKGVRVFVGLDESHNLNEITSLRTELFVDSCKELKSKHVLWLSGTPIKAIGSEAIPLISCIDELFTPACQERFRKIFGVSTIRAADILNHRLQGLMHVVEKKELGLPAPVFQNITVKVDDHERFTLDAVSKRMEAFTNERLAYYESRAADDKVRFYRCLDEHKKTLATAEQRDEFERYSRGLKWVIANNGDARACKDEMVLCNRYEKRKLIPSLTEASRRDFNEVKAIVKYVRLKVQGECLGRVVGKARMDACLELARGFDYMPVINSSEKKTVMFTSFTEVLEMLVGKMKDDGLKPSAVYGKTNHRLADIIEEFRDKYEVNPLLATYPSLSTAVPLVMANVCVLLNAPWRDYILQQTVSRISRLGQDSPTYVYTLCLDTGNKPNIADRALDILKWSQTQVKAITGVESPFEIGDDLSEATYAAEGFDLDVRFELGLESLDENPAKRPSSLSW